MTFTPSKYVNKMVLPVLKKTERSLGMSSYDKTRRNYYSRHGDGFIGVSYKISIYKPDLINIGMDCCISINDVQDTLLKIEYYDRKFVSDITWTYGIDIGYIIERQYAVWPLRTSDSLEQCESVVDEILAVARQEPMNFLNANCSKEAMLRIAQLPYSDKISVGLGNASHRALVGIILCASAGKSEEIPKFVKQAIATYSRPPADQYAIDRLLGFLEELGIDRH